MGFARTRLVGRRVGAGAAALAAAAMVPVVAASPAAAQDSVEIGTFAGKCLDVDGQSPADGARIVQYHCDGLFNQRFTIREVGNGQVEIETFAGKCLDVDGQNPADGARIVQYHCDGLFNQRFTLH